MNNNYPPDENLNLSCEFVLVLIMGGAALTTRLYYSYYCLEISLSQQIGIALNIPPPPTAPPNEKDFHSFYGSASANWNN